jgi:GNAT superfamily N-acetyltransferase
MLKQLSKIPYSAIVDTINNIFSDYEYKVQWKIDKFINDIKEFSIDLDASLAYVHKDEIYAISLTCIRNKRARMDSFGVIPSERNRGIATFLLKSQIDLLKSMNIEEYELEVLKSNGKAVEFYKKNHFYITDSLISLYSPLPPKMKKFTFDRNLDKAVFIAKSYSHERELCWIREPESLEKNNRYIPLVSGDFYVFYFKIENQCFIIDAFGKDMESKLASFFNEIEASLFSIVSLSQKDDLYKFLIKNNFMEFSEQWKMKAYL